MLICLHSHRDVASFCEILSKYPQSFDLDCGCRVVDAKSYFGVLATAIGKVAELRVVSPITDDKLAQLKAELNDYIPRGNIYVQ